MTTLVFNVTKFRVEYPEFVNVIEYPDDRLQFDWDTATCYISDQDYGRLQGECRQTALNLMTAHLAKLQDLDRTKETNNLVQNSSIAQVSVGLTPPPIKDQWGWWLSTTNYGQRLWALLQANTVGGWYLGGLPETLAYRKVGGIF